MSTYIIAVRCDACGALLICWDVASGSPLRVGETIMERAGEHLPKCLGRPPMAQELLREALDYWTDRAARFGMGHVPGQVSDRAASLRDYPVYKVPETTGD